MKNIFESEKYLTRQMPENESNQQWLRKVDFCFQWLMKMVRGIKAATSAKVMNDWGQCCFSNERVGWLLASSPFFLVLKVVSSITKRWEILEGISDRLKR